MRKNGLRWRALVALAVLVPCAAAPAADPCAAARQEADRDKAAFYPRRSYQVGGSGRLYFHSAPASACRSKSVFVIPADTLAAYAEFKGWYEVMYINPASGEDFHGWVRSDRLRYRGTLGPRQ